MNDEPHSFPFQETMDSRLLQLERELFSLTPAETPRCLASRLDGHLMAPLPVARPLAGGALPVARPLAGGALPVARPLAVGAVVAFRWRRMVVPAAAAVVVVSVFYRLEGHSGADPALAQQAGLRSAGPKSTAAVPAAALSTGYVLRAEPVYASPVGWEAAEHQYWIQPGSQSGLILSLPQRSSSVLPASFH